MNSTPGGGGIISSQGLFRVRGREGKRREMGGKERRNHVFKSKMISL